MAAEISTALGIEPELIAGSQGVFDIRANGKLVFSKDAEDRFPENDEVLRLLNRAMADSAR